MEQNRVRIYKDISIWMAILGFVIGRITGLPVLSVIIAIGCTILVAETINYWQTKRNDNNQKNSSITTNKITTNKEKVDIKEAKAIIRNTIHRLGYDIKEVEEDDDDRIIFECQGEHLYIIILEDEFRLFDPYWHHIPLDSLDNISLARKVMNLINTHCIPTLFYFHDTEENEMVISSRFHSPISYTDISDETYIQSLITEMLRVHFIFYDQMEKLRQAEYDRINKS